MTFLSVLVLSFSMALAAAPSFLQQNNMALAQQDAKASVQEVSTHVNEALKAYASAIGEQYFEAEHTPIQVNKTLIEQAKGVGEGKLVDRAAYQSAQDHLKTAQLMFVGLTPDLKNSYPEDVIEVQSGLLVLQNLFNYRAPYNLVEDAGFGVVLGHLDNLSK
ncbi:MAG TPA: hypothetical protein VHJ38_09315 [Nitrososphaeraceae archaeon]|nr:hypothetical protein [Nitrososphaeraceae archaeon]